MTGGTILGCIADDFTGATDLGSVLVAEGMRTVQTVGVPAEGTSLPPADAIVVALKSRTAPVEHAIRESRAALSWLRDRGVHQVFFKYCSTFDSTDAGNIGPVADAFMEDLDAATTVVCPALPENHRTVYQGHLFVGDRLLSESSMADHPLTPMRDADLVRHLGRQTPQSVGLISYPTVEQGGAAITAALSSLDREGVRFAVVDALDDAHLRAIGRACRDLPLVTGGSGVARGLPDNYREMGFLPAVADPTEVEVAAVQGPAIILSGSSSTATRRQVDIQRSRGPAFILDPLAIAADDQVLEKLSSRACSAIGEDPVLVSASAPPEQVRAVQDQLGTERAAALIEAALGRLAADLVAAGARRIIVAGGETSGAVVQALGVIALAIGPVIAPGVPWTRALREGPALGMVLKSGNFGGPDFFRDALAIWP